MATISAGGSGHGGKRALDHEIPLIPFIDLLLCCVMFLLVTAVWNQLSSMQASMSAPADGPAIEDPPPPSMVVLLESSRFIVSSGVGDRIEIDFPAGAPDHESLRAHLAPRRASSTGEIIVSADDDIAFESVIATMDTVAQAGFERVTMGDSR